MYLKDFVKMLDDNGKLVHIKREVDVKYEIATLMKMLDGKPLLFDNPKGFDMPVVANVCSTRELVALGLGCKQDEIIHVLSRAIETPKDPEIVPSQDYVEMTADLSALPILTYYPFDGGPYIASGIVVADDPEYGLNASYHRAMVIDKERMVMRILPRDFHKYLERGLKEFAFCVGNPIPVLLSAAVSAGTDVNELAIANSLAPSPLIKLDAHTVPPAEIVMICEPTSEMHDEGPFLDLTETPDIIRKQRVMRVKKIFRREGAIYHALLPGGLEHKTLMGMPREPTIYREVAKVCDVKDVLITPGGASWLHGAVSIRKKGPEDGRKAIEAALAGHKSMKHVFVVDEDIDIHNPHEIEWAMATRFQGEVGKTIIMRKEKGSSLDPSSDLETRETVKIGFDLTIPWGRDPKDFKKPPLPLSLNVEDYL